MDALSLRALVIFSVGYALVSARRLRLLPIGRPAGALVGSVAMVAGGVLSPQAAFEHVDLATLALLLGTMIISAHLAEAGFFTWAANRLAHTAAEQPRRFLAAIVWGAGLASALLVNDTVCLMFGPLLTAMILRAGLHPLPYLLALATSSNIGSAMSLTGNPQNMIIGSESGIPYLWFAAHMAPGTLAGLWINYRLLTALYAEQLRTPDARLVASVSPDTGTIASAMQPPDGSPPIEPDLMAKSLVALGVMVAGFALAPPSYLAWSALGAACVLLLLVRREPHAIFARVDFPLLIFFAALFVMVGGLDSVGLTQRAYLAYSEVFGDFHSPAGLAGFAFFSVVGSNVFSNVPFVKVVGTWISAAPGDTQRVWMVLALTSTLAGNLTLVGSVANIIVAETARPCYTLGFFEYLRFGVITTLATTVVGLAGLLIMHTLLSG